MINLKNGIISYKSKRPKQKLKAKA